MPSDPNPAARAAAEELAKCDLLGVVLNADRAAAVITRHMSQAHADQHGEGCSPETCACFRRGLESCRTHRCTKHFGVPQFNRNEHTGSECGACIAADLEARLRQAEERIKQLEHGHDEWRTLAHRAKTRMEQAEERAATLERERDGQQERALAAERINAWKGEELLNLDFKVYDERLDVPVPAPPPELEALARKWCYAELPGFVASERVIASLAAVLRSVAAEAAKRG